MTFLEFVQEGLEQNHDLVWFAASVVTTILVLIAAALVFVFTIILTKGWGLLLFIALPFVYLYRRWRKEK